MRTVETYEYEYWETRALAAEDDLTGLRKCIRSYCAKLRDPTRGGPVVFTAEVAQELEKMLDS